MKTIKTFDGYFDLQNEMRKEEEIGKQMCGDDFLFDDISDEIIGIMSRMKFKRVGDFWISKELDVQIYQDDMLDELWGALDLYIKNKVTKTC